MAKNHFTAEEKEFECSDVIDIGLIRELNKLDRDYLHAELNSVARTI